MAFYDESFLLSVARVIGKPIKVDMNTLRADRGRFARICVELDLTEAVVGKLFFEIGLKMTKNNFKIKKIETFHN